MQLLHVFGTNAGVGRLQRLDHGGGARAQVGGNVREGNLVRPLLSRTLRVGQGLGRLEGRLGRLRPGGGHVQPHRRLAAPHALQHRRLGRGRRFGLRLRLAGAEDFSLDFFGQVARRGGAGQPAVRLLRRHGRGSRGGGRRRRLGPAELPNHFAVAARPERVHEPLRRLELLAQQLLADLADLGLGHVTERRRRRRGRLGGHRRGRGRLRFRRRRGRRGVAVPLLRAPLRARPLDRTEAGGDCGGSGAVSGGTSGAPGG